MSRFDENTSTMRTSLPHWSRDRHAATLINLLKPELEPLTRARGIAAGVLLGVIMWIAIFALGVAIWRWIH